MFLYTDNRLGNFQIGADHEDKRPVPGQYPVMVTQKAPLGKGECRTFKGSVTGRYLIVQLLSQNYLTLCEVIAFGSKYSYSGID